MAGSEKGRPRGEDVEAIAYLTGLALLLFIGILGSIIARKAKVSSILVLALLGILIANTPLNAFGLFSFPPEFMVALSLLTLAMIVFDGSSRFTLRDLDLKSDKALELVLIFIATSVVILGTGTIALFLDWSVKGLLYALIFSVIMVASDAGSVFVILGETKHKVLDFLKLEAIINTPFVVIVPFLVLNILKEVSNLSVAATFFDFVMLFLQQVVVGVGAGMVVGIVVFRFMRKYYSETLSPVVIIATAILSYVIAENMGGNGVLAVATLGLIFGNTYVKRKGSLMEFSSLLSMSLEILVFLFIGMLVRINFDWAFFGKSLLLFGVALVARLVAVLITFHGEDYGLREKLFITLNMPKGIAVAVVTLTLYVLNAPIDGLLTLMILFVVYSLVVSSITDRFGRFFIRKEIVATPETVPKPLPAKPRGKK